jgi:hypothetical protein
VRSRRSVATRRSSIPAACSRLYGATERIRVKQPDISASQGRETALHGQRARSWQRHIGAALAPASSAEAIICEIVRLGDHYGVVVRGAVMVSKRYRKQSLDSSSSVITTSW